MNSDLRQTRLAGPPRSLAIQASLHLAEYFYDVESDSFLKNLTLFKERFEHDQGTQYIHNLYFVWLLELRAIHKAVPYIKKKCNQFWPTRLLFYKKLLHTEILIKNKKPKYSEI